jgi:hypothetical protein
LGAIESDYITSDPKMKALNRMMTEEDLMISFNKL